MTLFNRAIATMLLCAAVLPAFAEQARPSAGRPNEAELLKWKKDVLDRYKHVDYFNSKNVPISEGDFMRELREHHSGFTMTITQDNFERMVVRLMSPEEVAQEHSRVHSMRLSK